MISCSFIKKVTLLYSKRSCFLYSQCRPGCFSRYGFVSIRITLFYCPKIIALSWFVVLPGVVLAYCLAEAEVGFLTLKPE